MSQSGIQSFKYIDALRGIAILGVILVHSSQMIAPANKYILWLMGEGARGVQLFYVASALTLCMSWAARRPRERSPVLNFYIRRFFRIAPTFYLAIIFYIVVDGVAPSHWAPNGIEWWYILLTAFFLHGFHPETITSVVPGGWSIAVEMLFYVSLPFLLSCIKSIKVGIVFLVATVMLSAANYMLVPYVFSYPDHQSYLVRSFIFLNFFGQLPVFIVGILGYLFLAAAYSRKITLLVCGPLFLVFLLVFLYPAINPNSQSVFSQYSRMAHHFIAAGLFCVFAVLLASWPLRLFVNELTIKIGELSFGMYLSHSAVLKCFSRLGVSDLFAKSDLGSVAFFVIVATSAAIVSLFLRKWIELPGVRIGGDIIRRRESQST